MAIFQSIASVPNVASSTTAIGCKVVLCSDPDGNPYLIAVACSNSSSSGGGDTNICRLYRYSISSDDKTEHDVNSTRTRSIMNSLRCESVLSFPQQIEALALTRTFSKAPSDQEKFSIDPMLIVGTRDGRMYHSVYDDHSKTTTMIECKRNDVTNGHRETNKCDWSDPFLLGMDLFAVKSVSDDHDIQSNGQSGRDIIRTGVTMIAAGSSTLNPPLVIYIPPPSAQNATVNKFSFVKTMEVNGLEETDSIITSILFVDENELGKETWNGLLLLWHHSGASKLDMPDGDDVVGMKKSVALLGHEDGSLYCAIVTETSKTRDKSDTPSKVHLSNAHKVFQMSGPVQPILSILLAPSSTSPSLASVTPKIICVGSLGGIHSFLPHNEHPMFHSSHVSPATPFEGPLGILSSVAIFPSMPQSQPESKHYYPNQNSSFELTDGSRILQTLLSFITTSQDGSSFLFSVQFHNQQSGTRNNQTTRCIFRKLPLRKEMTSVSSCCPQKLFLQTETLRPNPTFFAFTTFRNGLVLMMHNKANDGERFDECTKTQSSKNKSALLSMSLKKKKKNLEKETNNVSSESLNKDNDQSNSIAYSKRILNELSSIIDGGKNLRKKRIGETSQIDNPTDIDSMRIVANIVSSTLQKEESYRCDDDNDDGTVGGLIAFEKVDGSNGRINIVSKAHSSHQSIINNKWTYSCNVIQRFYKSDLRRNVLPPSLDKLQVLSSRKVTVKNGVSTFLERKVKVCFGGVGYSISCKASVMEPKKKLKMNIKLSDDRYSILAFVSACTEYDGRIYRSPQLKYESEELWYHNIGEIDERQSNRKRHRQQDNDLGYQHYQRTEMGMKTDMMPVTCIRCKGDEPFGLILQLGKNQKYSAKEELPSKCSNSFNRMYPLQS